MVESDSRKTPIPETNLEGINLLLDYGYKVNDDIIADPENIPIPTGDTG